MELNDDLLKKLNEDTQIAARILNDLLNKSVFSEKKLKN